jgi:hypothetical protein
MCVCLLKHMHQYCACLPGFKFFHVFLNLIGDLTTDRYL